MLVEFLSVFKPLVRLLVQILDQNFIVLQVVTEFLVFLEQLDLALKVFLSFEAFVARHEFGFF